MLRLRGENYMYFLDLIDTCLVRGALKRIKFIYRYRSTCLLLGETVRSVYKFKYSNGLRLDPEIGVCLGIYEPYLVEWPQQLTDLPF